MFSLQLKLNQQTYIAYTVYHKCGQDNEATPIKRYQELT